MRLATRARTAHFKFIRSTLLSESYAVPLDLHSFPTRRSSDLVGARPGLDHARAHRRGHEGRGRREVEDRKSTRLNSSHTVISYAVFCLKKKTIWGKFRAT